MRTIKFRGKRIYDNKWIYGSLLMEDGYYSIIHFGITYMVFAETVAQFTGVTDKNGNDIYVGDVVTWKSNSLFGGYNPITSIIEEPVKFKNGAFYPVCTKPEKEFEIVGNIHFEIIGNIHEGEK